MDLIVYKRIKVAPFSKFNHQYDFYGMHIKVNKCIKIVTV